jgi:membrane-bound lytic murein transglycosylase D
MSYSMDWKINRNLATISLSILLSLSGYALGWASQPSQEGALSSSGRQVLYSPVVTPADSMTKQGPSEWSELPLHAHEFVKDYMQENRQRLERMKGRSAPYFRTIDNVFSRYGIPSELKYLAVIESDLNPMAISNKGAAGPWQIMPETGRGLGLRVDAYRDERVDLVKSTHAAAKYLKSLYRQLGDWLLVIAAYNGGPGRVESAIRQSNSRDFWALQRHLPAESRNHVKKFIATHYVMEGRGGVTTGLATAPIRNTPSVDTAGTVEQVVSGKFNSFVMAKNLSMDILRFNSLNPDFDRKVGAGEYRLRLPEDRMLLFNSRKMEIVAESVRFIMENGSTELDRNRAQTEVPRARIP